VARTSRRSDLKDDVIARSCGLKAKGEFKVRAIRRLTVGATVAAMLLCSHGCGTLAAPTLISIASSVVGGFATGSVMGGGTIGIIRSAAAGGIGGGGTVSPGEEAGTEAAASDTSEQLPSSQAAASDTSPQLASSQAVASNTARQLANSQAATSDTTQRLASSPLERACYFPNASGRGLPCT
jgi:hypothetical protein